MLPEGSAQVADSVFEMISTSQFDYTEQSLLMNSIQIVCYRCWEETAWPERINNSNSSNNNDNNSYRQKKNKWQ